MRPYMFTAFNLYSPFTSLPPVIVLHFVRFVHDGHTKDAKGNVYQGTKIASTVTLELNLDMRPFCAPAVPACDTPIMYSLAGFVVHEGDTVQHGHYYAFVRDGDGFIRVDDKHSTVERVSASGATNSGAYMALYERTP
jgi:ubiquitin C-terminal hydrolase